MSKQLDEYKMALRSADNHNHEMQAKLEMVTEQRDKLAVALVGIKNELGVVQPKYPARVANAVKIADEALQHEFTYRFREYARTPTSRGIPPHARTLDDNPNPTTMTRDELYQILRNYVGRDAEALHAVGDIWGQPFDGETEEITTTEWYSRRVNLLGAVQKHMRDPERTLVCDILANGQLLPDQNGKRYGFVNA